MSEVTRERQAAAGGDAEQSTSTEQAKETVQQVAGEGQQEVVGKAQEVRSQAADGVRKQLDSRSTQAGEQVSATAGAMRRVGEELRQEGRDATAGYATQAAEPLERLGRYLSEADGDRLLSDAERFVRQRPWVAVLGGATVGFFVARFIKASGTNGHRQAIPAARQTTGEDSDGQSTL